MAQRAATKKKGKMLMNVQLNADDEIDVVPVDKTDRSAQSDGEREDEEEEDDDDEESSDDPDSDPELVLTEDGRLMLDLKRNKSCPKCKKPMKTMAEMEAHKPKCPGMVDKVTDVILKEMKAAKHANPSDDFFKYCNPNPDHPCYCCGEDTSTAHVGHIRCQFCPKSFKAYEYLDRHIRSLHSESDEFQCNFCNAKCPSADILSEHLKTHNEGKPFSCTTCGKEFTRRYHLDRHVKHSNCGSDEKNMLPCEVCGKEFTRVDNLREHLRTHMGQMGRKRDYQCPYCPKSFYGSSLLNIHIRTHTGEKPFPCDLCPKSFPSSGALRKHRRKHTGERPYRCDECSATFAARETLNRHRKTHTGVKPHECKECGKRFIQATQLRTHMYVHTGKAAFKCKECGKAFPRGNKLNEHIKFEHRGEKPFECDECGKLFFEKTELNRHMPVHMNKKEYQCPCGNSYARLSSLKVHMKTHSTEDPVNCKICLKTFIRMDCLLRHMKKMHPEAVAELIEHTKNRKIEELQTSNTATVEINGEVFEIRSVGEAKDPVLETSEPVDESAVESVNVVEVVDIPVISSPASEPLTYDLLPITEETEVLIDDLEAFHEGGTPGETEELSICVEEPPVVIRKSPVKVQNRLPAGRTNAEASVVVKSDPVGGSAKVEQKKLKTEKMDTVQLEENNLVEVITVSASRKKIPPVSVTRETMETRPNTTDDEEPPIVSRKQVKASPPSNAATKAKETKPKRSRTSKEPAEDAGPKPEEANVSSVKRKRTREPKATTGRKRRRPDDDSVPIFLSDEMLAEKISELLVMLVGEEMLKEFGWPKTPIEEVLSQVILRCGHRPTKGEEAGDNTTRMRENTKIFFSVTMDEEDIKPLLNNHTIDEVIMLLLKGK